MISLLLIGFQNSVEAKTCYSNNSFVEEVKKLVQSHRLNEKSVRSLMKKGDNYLGSGFADGETMEPANIKDSRGLFEDFNNSTKVVYAGVFEGKFYCVGFKGIERKPYAEYAFCAEEVNSCYWLQGIYAISELKNFK